MLLSKHPEIVEKLRDEHANVFDKGFSTAMENMVASPQKLQELPYTEAVIKETLRLFPAGFAVRRAATDATVTYKGQVYPLNTPEVAFDLAINGMDTHYNPEIFPDPTSFDPKRWLNSEKPIPKSAFRTFGRGLRSCIGVNLAQNELKVILIMIITDYDFTCMDLKPHEQPKLQVTDLDATYGEIIFQRMGISAGVRGGMMMSVRRVGESVEE